MNDNTNTQKWVITIAILLVVLSALLTSCKTKKVFTEIIKTDTVKTTKIIRVTPAHLNELVIEQPCDSLGNLKPFYYKTATGKVTTIIQSKNDTVFVTQNIDSILEVREKQYKATYSSNNTRVEVPKIPKWVWYSLIFNILFILYIVKKLTNWLNFLPF